MKRTLAIIGVAGVGIASLAGCYAGAAEAPPDEPQAAAPQDAPRWDRDTDPWEQGPQQEPFRSPPEPSAAPLNWRCSYSPTMNYDWHDDVLCTNGASFDRPYLRPWDSFVTHDEIMQSAREYERQLNGL